MLRKIRMAVAGIAVLFVGGSMGYRYTAGEGTLHVHAPDAQGVTVRLDGQLPNNLGPGQHFETKLPQGSHSVTIETADGASTTHTVEVESGFYEQLVPATPEQCWVKIDARAYYEGFEGLPSVDDRFPATGPIEVGGAMYFSEESLPNSIRDGNDVFLMWEIPCALLSAAPDDVLHAIGYDF